MAVHPDPCVDPNAGSAGSTRHVPTAPTEYRRASGLGVLRIEHWRRLALLPPRELHRNLFAPRDGPSIRVISAISCGTATLMPPCD